MAGAGADFLVYTAAPPPAYDGVWGPVDAGRGVFPWRGAGPVPVGQGVR